MGLFSRLFGAPAELPFATRIPGAAAAPAGHIIPPDSPAIEMMRVQRELDLVAQGEDGLSLSLGKMGPLEFALASRARRARGALIAKVDRGEPVTVQDMIRTVGADRQFTASEGAQVLAAHLDARDKERSQAHGEGRDTPGDWRDRGGRRDRDGRDVDAEEARAKEQAERATRRCRPLPDWLAVPPSRVLTTMAQDPSLANPGYDAGDEYEAVSIAWARTVVGEGLVRAEALPPAVRQWVLEDAEFHDSGVLERDGVERRAAVVDALSWEHTRARAQMLPPLKHTQVRLAWEAAQRGSSAPRAASGEGDPRDPYTPRWSVHNAQTPRPARGAPTGGGAPATASRGPAASAPDLDAAFDYEPEVSDEDLPPTDLAYEDPLPPLTGCRAAPAEPRRPEPAPSSVERPRRVADAAQGPSPEERAALERATAGQPRVWVDDRPVAGVLAAAEDGQVVVVAPSGESVTMPGRLSRQDGPAVETADPTDDRYYVAGEEKPMGLPPALYAARDFRGMLHAGWRRFGHPADARPLATTLVATWPPDARAALLDELRASAAEADRAWAESVEQGQGPYATAGW